GGVTKSFRTRSISLPGRPHNRQNTPVMRNQEPTEAFPIPQDRCRRPNPCRETRRIVAFPVGQELVWRIERELDEDRPFISFIAQCDFHRVALPRAFAMR